MRMEAFSGFTLGVFSFGDKFKSKENKRSVLENIFAWKFSSDEVTIPIFYLPEFPRRAEGKARQLPTERHQYG